MSTKKVTQHDDSNVSENAAARRTIETKGNFGQVAWTISCELVANDETAPILAEGIKSFAQTASSKLDSHKEFGNFGHKGTDGKIVERGDYKRGKIAYTDERAEIVRQTLATSTLPNSVVTVTTGRYESTAVKSITVEDAHAVSAKGAIASKNSDPHALAELAKKVGFAFDATNELTTENAAFVSAIAKYLAASL